MEGGIQMNRNRWLIVIAVALMLSAGLTYLIFRVVQKRLRPPEETKRIVVAAQKLSLGKSITEEDVKMADWPKSIPLEGSFNSLETVLERGVISTIYPNEPILDVKLAPREGGAGLPSVIPDGMRALSLKVDSVIGVAGFVLPGTRVDVVLTGTPPNAKEGVVSRIVLENIQVLTAGQQVEQDAKGQPVNVSVVTLLVTPEQAQEMVLMGSDRVQLLLRNPLDTEIIDPEAVARERLFVPDKKAKPETETLKKSVQPKRRIVVAPTPKPEPKPEPRITTIEMIRGNSKENLNFTEKAQ